MNKLENQNNTLILSPKTTKNLFSTHETIDSKFLNKKLFKVSTTKVKKFSDIGNTQGYWSKTEHIKFIEALYLYNCHWPKIQKHLRNRTYEQVRSHAQKFYLKLKSFKDEELGIDFTSPNVKNLKDIIRLIKEKEEESLSDCNEKLLYIISEKLSFGKTPRRHEEEIIIEIEEEDKKK